MAKRIAGTFNGTGAALYICCGFIPDWVVIQNCEDGDLAKLEWNIHMARTGEVVEGFVWAAAAAPTALTKGTGVIPYYSGGTKLAATSTVYLVRDDADYRTSVTYGTIETWTLGSATNYTGNWNLEADTTYIGEGSIMTVEETMGHNVITTGVVAVTSNGEAANEVTLAYPVKTGKVTALKRMYSFAGGVSGDILPDGFKINATAVINVSGEICMFEAGTYDIC